MDDNLFYTGAFNQSISINPRDFKKYKLDDLILLELKKEIENKCLKYGFVKKDSIQVLKRTIGSLNSSQLNGSINYDINFSALVCNPTSGQTITCMVKNKNKMGILAEKKPIIIVIAKNNMRNKSEFDTIEIDSEINVEIIGSRFDLYDTNITAIGKIVK